MRTIILITTGLSVGLLADFSRDNITEIVTDNTIGLQWQDNNDAKNITKIWIEAIDYCESLILGGYSDWRLPNINELYSIVDLKKSNPAIDGTFQNVASYYYLSSTWTDWDRDYASSIVFDTGYCTPSNKNNFTYHVRCVRGGQ